mgnify:FL=1
MTTQVDLTRPRYMNRTTWAVAIIGCEPAGPWRVIHSQQPQQELQDIRKSQPKTIAVAVRWCKSRELAQAIAQKIETRAAPVRAGQKLPEPLFEMTREKVVAMFTSCASLSVQDVESLKQHAQF